MAMNFMGLGFSFFGKDDGLNKGLDSATDRVDRLTSAMANVSKHARDLEQLSKQGRTLMTGMEADLLHMHKTGKETSYNLGASADEMARATKRATQLTLQLGVSTQEATVATIELARAKEQFAAIGIKSDEELVKSANVLGVSATKLRETLQLAGSMGITAGKGLEELDKAFQESARQAGDMSLSVTGMEHALRGLDEVYVKKTGKNLKGKELAKFGIEAAKTAAALKELGYGGAEAMAAGTELLGKQIEDQAKFVSMFAGKAEDIPDQMKEWAISFGDANDAFKMMQKGPAELMEGMARMLEKVRSKGGDVNSAVTFIGKRIEDVYGKEMSTKMIKFAMNASSKTVEAMNKVTTASKTMGEASRAFVDDRTLDQHMKIAEDLMEVRIRNINKTAGKFLKDSQWAFKAWGSEIEKMGSDKGPLGAVIGKLVDLDHVGYLGLLPKHLQGTANALGSISGKIGKIIEGMMSPFGIFKTAIMTVSVAILDAFVKGPTKDQNGKEFGYLQRLENALLTTGEYFAAWAANLPDKIIAGLDTAIDVLSQMLGDSAKSGKVGKSFAMWWDQVVQSWSTKGPVIEQKLKKMWKLLTPYFEKAWKSVKEFFSEMWEGVLDPEISNKEGSTIAQKIGSLLGEAMTALGGDLKAFGKNLWNGLTGEPTPELMAANSKTVGGAIGQWLKSGWDEVEKHLVKFGSDVWQGLTSEVANSSSERSAGERLGEWLGNALSSAWDMAASFVGKKIKQFLSELGGKIVRGVLAGATLGMSEALNYGVEKYAGKDLFTLSQEHVDKGHKILAEQERQKAADSSKFSGATNIPLVPSQDNEKTNALLSMIANHLSTQTKLMQEEKNKKELAYSPAPKNMSTPKENSSNMTVIPLNP